MLSAYYAKCVVIYFVAHFTYTGEIVYKDFILSSLTGVNKSLVIFAALVIVLAGIKAASVIVIPFVLAAFIAIICNPLIRFFARMPSPKR